MLPMLAQALTVCGRWPEWEGFKRTFISDGGRVVDLGAQDQRTVSEGQAYALFFSLVAGDKAAFERVLGWTENNLAGGDLTAHLPAWLWGHKEDGSWAVLDANPAADADLWIAYALAEAGRLWGERRYAALGQLLANRVLREEVAPLPGLGETLLPGPVGFKLSDTTWRLNPSYVPLQVLARFSALNPDKAVWRALDASSRRLLTEAAPHGLAPEWVQYQADAGFRPDQDTKGEGSYNAIRVYLWLGMLSPRTPGYEDLLAHYRPLASATAAKGFPPERVDSAAGVIGSDAGPAGFSGALLPYLAALKQQDTLDEQLRRHTALADKIQHSYYSQVLSLFGRGWLDGRFRFNEDGVLQTAWNRPCFAAR
jgi:endoglucanase